MIFALEPLEACWDELILLYAAHWKETEGYRHGQPFDPRFERYNEYNRLGWFLMFTARDEGKLVGNAGIYMVPSMHTQQMIATEDTWFLLPEYRKGRNAWRFYNFIEAECWSRGAVEITFTAKPTTRVGPMLERLNFKATSVQYTKQRADSALTQEPTDVRGKPSSNPQD